MADEIVIKSGNQIAVGDKFWEVRDADTPIEYVDFLTEARMSNGVVCLSFGSGVVDANNDGFVNITSRMRMHLGTAQFLHKMLGDMISEALKPIDKSQAN